MTCVGAFLDNYSHREHVHLLLGDYGEPYGKITVVFGWPAKLESVKVRFVDVVYILHVIKTCSQLFSAVNLIP